MFYLRELFKKYTSRFQYYTMRRILYAPIVSVRCDFRYHGYIIITTVDFIKKYSVVITCRPALEVQLKVFFSRH